MDAFDFGDLVSNSLTFNGCGRVDFCEVPPAERGDDTVSNSFIKISGGANHGGKIAPESVLETEPELMPESRASESVLKIIQKQYGTAACR